MLRTALISAAAALALIANQAPAKTADRPLHPEWHVTHKQDAFESRTTVDGRGDAGKSWVVASCDDEQGFSLIGEIAGMPKPRESGTLDERMLIVKAGDAAPERVAAVQIGTLLSADHIERLAPLFANNQKIGIRVKWPDGRVYDNWFVFSSMDAQTRATLLSCARSHA